MGYFFAPMQLAWPRTVAFAGVQAVSVIGLTVFAKRSPVTLFFLLSYMAVVLMWPFGPDRFVIGVWPLLTLCFIAGFRAIWKWTPPSAPWRGFRLVSIGAVAALVAGFLSFNVRGYRHQFWASIQRDAGRRVKPVAEWVAARTDQSDVLMTDDDVLIYLYTGRQGTPTSGFLPREHVQPLTDDDNIAAVRAMIAAYSPRYYITTSEPGRRAAEALAVGPHPLLRRHRLIPNAFIYERIGS